MKKKEFTEEELEQLRYDYEVLKIPKSRLSKKYHTSYDKIKKILTSLGLDLGYLVAGKNKGGRKRKYDFNDSFFEEIDTEEKAYWLGFFYADGYITGTKHVGLSLASSDRSHLEKFIVSIEGDSRNIKDYTRQTAYGVAEYSRVLLVSDKMFKDLSNKGVSLRKTNTLNDEFVKNLDIEYVKPFIRGYIDGDGSVSGLKKSTYAVKVCGTDAMLRFIERELPINKKERVLEKRRKGQTVSQLSISGTKQVISSLEYLYGDANIYLDRKYQKAHRILSEL